MKRFLLSYLVSALFFCSSYGRNIRYIDTSSGLSSQFVLSLCQDEDGFIWAGAYSGLNMIAGTECLPFGFGNGNFQTMGNCINRVLSSGDAIWIHTNVGMERYNPQDGTMERYNQFRGSYRMFTSHAEDVLVMTEDGQFYYYNRKNHQFELLKGLRVKAETVREVFINRQHEIIILERENYRKGKLATDEDGVTTYSQQKSIGMEDANQIRQASYDGKYLFVINDKSDLLMTSNLSEFPVYQYNLRELMAERGAISSIVRDHNNIIIGFLTSGAVCLTYAGEGQYVAESMPISYGVFDVLKDARQEIVWLATDGAGLCAVTNEPYTIHNEHLQDLNMPSNKPVRALLMDKNGTMWVGTKGDGIVTIADYHPFGESGSTKRYTMTNSGLTNNSVYCISESKRNLLWIGTDGAGLNYYSFASNSIHHLEVKGKSIIDVQDILEISRDELWVTTKGYGVFQIFLEGSDDQPTVKSASQHLYLVHPTFRVIRQS